MHVAEEELAKCRYSLMNANHIPGPGEKRIDGRSARCRVDSWKITGPDFTSYCQGGRDGRPNASGSAPRHILGVGLIAEVCVTARYLEPMILRSDGGGGGQENDESSEHDFHSESFLLGVRSL
jgi:hypothetical protein